MDDVVLATERLQLRKMSFSDTANLREIFMDPEAMRFYPSTLGEAETVAWISRTLHNYETVGSGFWVVEDRLSGRFLGQCGIIPQELDGVMRMEVAYLLVRREWHQGYATEAARACRDYGFSTMGLTSLVSLIDIHNTASQRVAERIGMRVEQTIRRWGKDVLVYSVTRAPGARPAPL